MRILLFQPKKKVGKKVAAAPLVVKKVEPKKVVNPLFEKRTKNFAIGKFLYSNCFSDDAVQDTVIVSAVKVSQV